MASHVAFSLARAVAHGREARATSRTRQIVRPTRAPPSGLGRVARGASLEGSSLRNASAAKGQLRESHHRRASIMTTASSSERVFLDISVDGEAAGRLVFALEPEYAPQTVANFQKQISGEMTSVDRLLSYKGCEFEPYKGKYAYTCKGRGKNIYGTKKFVEQQAMSASRQETPGSGGGVYYGVPVDLNEDPDTTVVAVPISGPGFGGSRFVIVRVGASPGTLQQRLLANMMVLGKLVEGGEVLLPMASREARVVIEECGLC